MFSCVMWLSDVILCIKSLTMSYSAKWLNIMDNIKYYCHLLGMQNEYYINSPSPPTTTTTTECMFARVCVCLCV